MEIRQKTKIVLTYKLLEEGVSKSHIAKRLGIYTSTIDLLLL